MRKTGHYTGEGGGFGQKMGRGGAFGGKAFGGGLGASPRGADVRSAGKEPQGIGVWSGSAVESAIGGGAAAETRRRMSEGAQRPSLRRRRRSAFANGEPKAANVCADGPCPDT